jgi:hypothetical protein
MAREQPLPHIDPPKIEPRPLSQAHDFPGLLGYAAGNDHLTRFLSYAIAVLRAVRPWEDDKRNTLRPYWKGFTPRAMAAEHARTIKQQRRAKRTGQDDQLRRKLQDPSRIDYASAVRLGWHVADSPMPSVEAVQAAREACLAWGRINPQWEAVRLAVIFSAYWFWLLAAPTVRSDKALQLSFVLDMLEDAGYGVEGLRRHPERLYQDEIVGPFLALLLRAQR